MFEVEPLPDWPLRRLEHVVLTPHVAGVERVGRPAMAARCVEIILEILRGERPGPGLVLNPEVLAQPMIGARFDRRAAGATRPLDGRPHPIAELDAGDA